MLHYFTEEFKGCEIIRTTNRDELQKADLLFDIGYKYDPLNNMFDHN